MQLLGRRNVARSRFRCVALWVYVVLVVCIQPSAAQLPTLPLLQPSFQPTEGPTDLPTITQTPSFQTITQTPSFQPTANDEIGGEGGNIPGAGGSDKDSSTNKWIEAVGGALAAVVVLVLVVGAVIKRGRDQKNDSDPTTGRRHHHHRHRNKKDKRQRPNDKVDDSITDFNSFELTSGASTNSSGSPPPSSTNYDDMYMLSDDQSFSPDVRLDMTSLGDSHRGKNGSSNSLALLVPSAVEELIGPLRLVITTDFYPLYLRNERSNLRCFPVCREFNEAPSLDENVPVRMHKVLKRGTCGDAIRARVTALKTHVASDLVLLGRVSSGKLSTDLSADDTYTYSQIADLEKNSHYMRGVVTTEDAANAECMGDRCTFMVSFKPQGQWMFKGRQSKKHPLYFEVFVLGPDSFRHRAVRFDSLGNASEAGVLDTGVNGSIGRRESRDEAAKFADDLGDLFGDGFGDMFGDGLDQEDIVVLDGLFESPSEKGASAAHSIVESRATRPSESGRHRQKKQQQQQLVFGEGLTLGKLSCSSSGTRKKQELVVLGSTRSCNFQCATTKSRRVVEKQAEKR